MTPTCVLGPNAVMRLKLQFAQRSLKLSIGIESWACRWQSGGTGKLSGFLLTNSDEQIAPNSSGRINAAMVDAAQSGRSIAKIVTNLLRYGADDVARRWRSTEGKQ